MENAQTWKGGQILKAWNFEGKLTRSELGFDESRFFFDVMSGVISLVFRIPAENIFFG